jgi:cytochrome c-type biogenesis protein CcmH/NrfG
MIFIAAGAAACIALAIFGVSVYSPRTQVALNKTQPIPLPLAAPVAASPQSPSETKAAGQPSLPASVKKTPVLEGAQTWIARGIPELKSGEYARAEEAFQKALQIDPSNVTALLYLGGTWMDQSFLAPNLRSTPN